MVVVGKEGGLSVVVLISSGKSKLKPGVVFEVASVVRITIVPVGIAAVVSSEESFFMLTLKLVLEL